MAGDILGWAMARSCRNNIKSVQQSSAKSWNAGARLSKIAIVLAAYAPLIYYVGCEKLTALDLKP
jgi:hypothetical protein